MSEEGQNINPDEQNTEPTVNNDDQNPTQNPEENPTQEPTDQNTEGGNEGGNNEPASSGSSDEPTEPVEPAEPSDTEPSSEEGGNAEGGEQGGEQGGEGGAEEGGEEGEGEGESTEEEEPPKPVNCWQYSRDVYLLGRSWKFRYFTEDERAAIIEFIIALAGTRPAYVDYINLKVGNPPAAEYVEEDASSSDADNAGDEQGGEGEAQETETEKVRKLAWTFLEKQNDETLGKILQKLGKSLKVQFCTQEEKELCDALFEATDHRRHKTLNDYVDIRAAAESSSESSSEEGGESSGEGGEEGGDSSESGEGGSDSSDQSSEGEPESSDSSDSSDNQSTTPEEP